MAATPSGWLKPPDLTKRSAARRALQLLGEFLDDEQRAQAERYGGFAVSVPDRVFWIPLEGPPWCAFADDGRVERYCIAPDERGGMPHGDVTLTYLLWIKSDPDGFLHEANVLQKKNIVWPDSDDELVHALAELTKPAPARRAPRRQRRRRSFEEPLSEATIREIFHRYGKAVPDEVVAVLTRQRRPA